jgi:hypothetical protein
MSSSLCFSAKSRVEIGLIPDEHNLRVRVRELLQVLRPLVQVVEGGVTRDIEDEDAADRIPEMRARPT